MDKLLRQDSPATWKRLLAEKPLPGPAGAGPSKSSSRRGDLSSADLLRIFRESDSHQLRMQAFVNLTECRDDNFIEAIALWLVRQLRNGRALRPPTCSPKAATNASFQR